MDRPRESDRPLKLNVANYGLKRLQPTLKNRSTPPYEFSLNLPVSSTPDNDNFKGRIA
jgi:hypothetical protein